MTIFRRALVLGALMCTLASNAAAEPARAGRVEFEVLRGGQPFGRQGVTVTESDGALVAQTSADLRAQLGPITVFHYTQRCREVWRAGVLTDLRCTTLKNGHTQNVSGAADGSGLRVTGAGGAFAMPAETWPTTWWTRPRIGSHVLINTETGQRLPVRVTQMGRETIDVGNERVAADHIRVAGTVTLDLWYDERGSWVSSAFTASGQHITYRLLSPRASGPA